MLPPFMHASSAQQMVTILSVTLTLSSEVHINRLMGSVDFKMVNFCVTTIILSTWIQTLFSFRKRWNFHFQQKQTHTLLYDKSPIS